MSEKQAFTLGKWEWLVHDHSCASLGVGDSPGMGTPLVMSVSPCAACAERATDGEWKWGRCCTPSEADAHLIAAAPDMFEALVTALPYIEMAEEDEAYKPGAVAKVTKLVRAALTRATGGQS